MGFIAELDLLAFRFVNNSGFDLADPFFRLVSSNFLWWALALVTLLGGLIYRRGQVAQMLLCLGIAIGLADVTSSYALKPNFARL